jgi:glycosyltransferase involved in cell wall biosynthesis
MKQPFFSIILTTYARPDYLKLAIRSVLNQDFSDYELIVLDDASPDNTEKVVRFFNDKRIVYIKNKINLGFPKNFKSGVEIAKGVYIFLLSDDDLILKSDTLSIVERGMKKRSVGFGQLGLIFYDEDLYRPLDMNPKICTSP